MKNLTSTACFLLLLACQPKNSADQTVDSTATDTALVVPETDDTNLETAEPVIEENMSSTLGMVGQEVLVLPGVVVYLDSITEETMGERAELEKVRVMAMTGLRYPQGDDLCNQYFRYDVLFAGDEDRGWVSGEDVLLINANDAYVGGLTFNGKSYQVFYAYDTGIGPSDSNGLTGCNSHSLPYLLDTKSNAIRFIDFADNNGNGLIEAYRGWFSLISSEGGSARITALEADETEIRFNLNISYQEGGETIIVHIAESEGALTVSSLQTVEEESGD